MDLVLFCFFSSFTFAQVFLSVKGFFLIVRMFPRRRNNYADVC